jgi:hypothetical protein
MKRRLEFALLAMLLCIGSCAHSFAQQDQPPASVNPPPSPSADQTQPPAPTPQTGAQPQTETQPQIETQPQTEAPQQSPVSKKAKPAAKKRSPAKKHRISAQSGKVVVRNGGAKDNSGQLTPAMSPEQELHSRENTWQLLVTTDSNLKKVGDRQLSGTQQSMLDQIHTYVRQSKAASDSGDLTRAHTLAYKAHLLSDELISK